MSVNNLNALWGKLKNSFSGIPKQLKIFILRGISFFIIWKLLYLFFLKPNHFIDHQLTTSLGKCVYWVFKNLSPSFQSAIEFVHTDVVFSIIRNGKRSNVLLIADACNALELMILYLGFLAASTLPFLKQIHYWYSGIILIFFINLVRCLFLIYISIYSPTFFVLAHHYIFTSIVYLLIFLIWRRYIKTWIKHENSI